MRSDTCMRVIYREKWCELYLVFKRLYQIVQIMPNLSGGHSDVEPPESFPNSEVKHVSADGSVGLPHVRVGHRQAPNTMRTPA